MTNLMSRGEGEAEGWQTEHPPGDRWIQTYTGRKFYPLNPSPDDIDILDIAHALAMKVRYTGHCRAFYSVAEHSIHMARFADGYIDGPEVALWALLHDASEAYLPDVSRPIKDQIPGFREWEDAILEAVAIKYDLLWPIPPDVQDFVKGLDTRILLTEMDLLLPGDEARNTLDGYEPLDVRLHLWTPAWAEREFLSVFHKLQGERHEA